MADKHEPPTYLDLVHCILGLVVQSYAEHRVERDPFWRFGPNPVKREGLRMNDQAVSAGEIAENVLADLGIVDGEGWFLLEPMDREAVAAKIAETFPVDLRPQPPRRVRRESLKDQTCPQCSKPFSLVWNDYGENKQSLVIRECPSGGVYDVYIRCPHCNFEEPL